jgi:hypothetical protein
MKAAEGLIRITAVSAAAALAAPASAADPRDGVISLHRRAQDADNGAPVAAPAPAFGDAGSRYWSLGGGAAFHTDSTDGSAYGSLGFFLADRFEFNAALAGWGFWQEGEDAAGVNPSIGFRYHFMPKEPFNIYAEAGIGLLFTTEDVPQDGTSVNFTPRAGLGTLIRLDESSGLRLDLGVRWHHISNASFRGTDDNPARDSVMIYAGVVVPF